MKKAFSVLDIFLFEVIIIVLFMAFIRTFLPFQNTISGDGSGYYEYLPSTFIYHDIARKNFSGEKLETFKKRTENYNFYLEYNGHFVNRYPCGTAILQLPFFIGTLNSTKLEGSFKDGFQNNFHSAVYYSALFYLFLALIFLKKLLELYSINKSTIYISELFLVFATSVTQYASANSAFSHIYSFFAVTAFLFFTKKYFDRQHFKSFLWASVFLGLVVILRNVNLVIIMFVPFLAGSWENFKKGILAILGKPVIFIGGLFLFFCVVLIQFILWYVQTGSFILYSYQGYGFNFFDPQFINILFSYSKGLFVYTPILFFGIIGLVWIFYKKEYYLVFTWLLFFVFLTYILSSWEAWYYGKSYGLRAYIDFYAIFFIPFAILLSQIKWVYKAVIIAVAIFTIPLNRIQNYQYQNYIIHGTIMDKTQYWKVFLKTNEVYKGIFYKKIIDENEYKEIKVFSLNDIEVPENKEVVVLSVTDSIINTFNSVNVIQVLFENDFPENNLSRFVLSIKNEEGKVVLYHRPYFIHFSDKKFNQHQTGKYNYELPDFGEAKQLNFTFAIMADENGASLENLRIRFLSKKE